MAEHDDGDSLMIDARGLKCPLPVLRLAKVLREAPSGRIVHLLADDPMAVIDVPHFCNETNHKLQETVARDAHHLFIIRAHRSV